ncbi:MAG: MFS transporter [Caulobacteraceae bacterium]
MPATPAVRSPNLMLRSLSSPNYRLWVVGALVSNIGTWMQRTAQDWLVLTRLTHHSASAVGVVMALQFGPQLLFLPWTGYVADVVERRRLLILTQAAMGVLAGALGLLTVTGLVQLWHVYVFAFLFGTASAFDAPARQTFVSDLVGDEGLSNAVALNSTSFNLGRMLGPAASGLCIAAWGTGWAFLINGASFIAVLGALCLIQAHKLHPCPRAVRGPGQIVEGFRYVRARPDLRAMLVMLFLIGAFAFNFPIYISTMAVTVFKAGAGRYGMLTSIMAVGTTAGALLAAGRKRPTFKLLVIGSAVLGLGFILGAAMPNYWLFAATLVMIGVASLTFTNSSTSLMQLSTDPMMRGRVMALRLAVVQGSTPIGAPLVGWIADRYGPRWALGVGAVAGIAAAGVGLRFLLAQRRR